MAIFQSICTASFLLIFSSILMAEIPSEPWKLPVVTPLLEHHHIPNKHHQRTIWIGFKVAPSKDNMPEHVKLLHRTNPTWKIAMFGAEEQTQFMEKHYGNTSLLWAYNALEPKIGVSYCDIWRYAVLWMHGGFYLDDDAFIKSPLDDIVHVNDSMVISTEKNENFDCYHSDHHLSQPYLSKKYQTKENLKLFGGRTVVQWGFYVQARSPYIYQTMKNAVEVIKLEYLRSSSMVNRARDEPVISIFCATGPLVFTATIREMIMEARNSSQSSSPIGSESKEVTYNGVPLPRLVSGCDFSDYGGVYKVKGKTGESYIDRMLKGNISLLHHYAPNETETGLHRRLLPSAAARPRL